MAVRGLTNLCRPAYIYLVISIFALVIVALQNIGSNTTLCVGMLSCDVPNTAFVFAVDILYILFWTWILNLICDAGAPLLSWLIVLIPIVISFIIVALMMI